MCKVELSGLHNGVFRDSDHAVVNSRSCVAVSFDLNVMGVAYNKYYETPGNNDDLFLTFFVSPPIHYFFLFLVVFCFVVFSSLLPVCLCLFNAHITSHHTTPHRTTTQRRISTQLSAPNCADQVPTAGSPVAIPSPVTQCRPSPAPAEPGQRQHRLGGVGSRRRYIGRRCRRAPCSTRGWVPRDVGTAVFNGEACGI